MTTVSEIKEAFEKVLIYSQNLKVDHLKINDLFSDWEKNKNSFYEMFGKKYTKELGPVEIDLDYDAKEKNLVSFLDEVSFMMRENSISEGTAETFFLFMDGVRPEDFYNNTVSHDWVVHDDKRDKEVNLKGMKLLKSFKYYVEGNKDLLDDMQSLASRIIQKAKIKGTLCLSIHPLDYLSASENNHNWRSCHALDGEYRAGNLNYMADATTIMCYVKSDNEDQILPHFPSDVPWNSKKWRMWLFFSEDKDLIMAGRQYPFNANHLLPQILKEVELMSGTKFSPWTNSYMDSMKVPFMDMGDGKPEDWDVYINSKMYMVVPGPAIAPIQDIVSNGDQTYHYNDLLNSSTYTLPYYSFEKSKNWFSGYNDAPKARSGLPKIKVGKSCTCVECGSESIGNSDSVLCLHCMVKEGQMDDTEIFGNCYLCDEPFILDEGVTAYIRGGSYYVCPDCVDNGYIKRCESCGEYILASELNEDGICEDCVLEIEEKKTKDSTTQASGFDTGDQTLIEDSQTGISNIKDYTMEFSCEFDSEEFERIVNELVNIPN